MRVLSETGWFVPFFSFRKTIPLWWLITIRIYEQETIDRSLGVWTVFLTSHLSLRGSLGVQKFWSLKLPSFDSHFFFSSKLFVRVPWPSPFVCSHKPSGKSSKTAEDKRPNWRFRETKPLISLNDSIEIVQRFHWFRSTIPMDLFRETGVFVSFGGHVLRFVLAFHGRSVVCFRKYSYLCRRIEE